MPALVYVALLMITVAILERKYNHPRSARWTTIREVWTRLCRRPCPLPRSCYRRHDARHFPPTEAASGTVAT